MDEIRENYKTLRQSRDTKLKLNGATYRKIRGGYNSVKLGNTISRAEDLNSSKLKDFGFDELNEKYNMHQPGRIYSLNKHKRWEIKDELIKNMSNFTADGVDVRLYETRNRNEKKANCIAIHKSKGEQISVKHTYANLDSIIQKQELDNLKKRTEKANPNQNGKNKKQSKPSLKLKEQSEEHIFVDFSDDDDESEDEEYVQYQIEYAPTKDTLKYGIKKLNTKNEFSSKKTFKYENYLNKSDDLSDEISSEEGNEEKTISDQEPNGNKCEKEIDLSLVDLINKYSDDMIKKLTIKTAHKKEKTDLANADSDVDIKQRKVFIERPESTPVTTEIPKNANKFIKLDPKLINLSSKSVESDNLKESYGMNYNEALNCWPRSFNLNMASDLKKAIDEKYSCKQNLDIIVWLVFKEDVSQPFIDPDLTRFKISFCSNFLIDQTDDLMFFDLDSVYDIDFVYKNVLERFAQLPIDSFRKVQYSKSFRPITNLALDLPNIGGSKIVKTIDELKLNAVASQSDLKDSLKVQSSDEDDEQKFARMNSIEVVKKDVIVDLNKELEISERINQIFKSQKYECILCFEQKADLNDCNIIKSCAHCVCDMCMRDFVDSRLPTSKLECPGCDSELELSTLIQHGSDGVHVDNYIRSTVERIVFTLNEYKWCPSPSCGKVLKVDIYSNPFGTVSCTCGFKMCLKCNNAPHFPAKCSQIANYYEELKSQNDFVNPNDEIILIKGKRCPKCNTFVEKNGGCNHMICSLCRENFCWKCLECFGQTYIHNDCKDTFASVTVEFKKKADNKQKTTSNYEDSLVHRQKRSTAYQRVLRDNANNLLSRIKNSELKPKSDSRNENTDVSFILEKRSELREFLNEMMKFLNELHFICEHSYVLLSDKSLEKEKADRIKRLVRSFELLIWRIELIFESNTSNLKSFESLKELYNKGLNLIGLFRNIKLE